MEYEGASNLDAQFLARLLARVRPRRLLELGCGSGRVTFTLAAALPKTEIVGLDSSIEMLGMAAAAHDAAESSVRKRVSFVKGDMRDWQGAGDAFDAAVIACCSVSHLLSLDDRRRTWATAFRLLRPGGIFIRTPTRLRRSRHRCHSQEPGGGGTVASMHRYPVRAAPAAGRRAPDLRPVRPTRAGGAPRRRLRQPRLLPVGARVVVCVGGIRDRSAVRRLPVRALRPDVAVCRHRSAPAASFKRSPVSHNPRSGSSLACLGPL